MRDGVSTTTTDQAVNRGPTLVDLRNRVSLLEEIRMRRAGVPREAKQLKPATLQLLNSAIQSRGGISPSAPALAPALIAMLSKGKSASTWNDYAGALRSWTAYAAAAGTPFLPADPVHFANFLATESMGEKRYGQTKRRVCAIDAISNLAETPSPAKHPLVTAFRSGALRTLTFHRGQKVAVLSSDLHIAARQLPSLVQTIQDHQRSSGIRRWTELWAESVLTHMHYLTDGALRWDDAHEGQLGDHLWFEQSRVVDIGIFGSKTDPMLLGQPGVMIWPEDPESGANRVLRGIQAGLERLVALPSEVLATITTRFRTKHGYSGTPGVSAMRTWPACVLDVANRLYSMGLPVHCLSIYGRWLVDKLDVETDLSAPIPYNAFLRSIKRILAAAGLDAAGVGAHSFRRGGTAERIEEGASNSQIMHLLRHRSTASGRTYILSSARSTALAQTSDLGHAGTGGMIASAGGVAIWRARSP